MRIPTSQVNILPVRGSEGSASLTGSSQPLLDLVQAVFENLDSTR